MTNDGYELRAFPGMPYCRKVVVESEREHPRHQNMEVSPFMMPLVKALALKRPTWTFMAKGYPAMSPSDSTKYLYSSFNVFEHDEELGTIATLTRTDGPAYNMRNSRITRSMTRGHNGISTSDLSRAVKTVLKHFAAPSPAEIMERVKGLVTTPISSAVVAANRSYNGVSRTLSDALCYNITTNPAFAALISDNIPSMADSVVELREYDYAKGAALADYSKFDTGNGTFIKASAGRYMVRTSTGISVWDEGKLPDNLRTAIGLLKLVDDATYVPGVGVRHDASYFWVVEETNGEA